MPMIKKFGLSSHQEDAAVLNNGTGGCELTKFECHGQVGESYRKGDIVRLVSSYDGSRSAYLMTSTSITDIISAGWIVVETYTDTADEGVGVEGTNFMIVAKMHDQGFYEINLATAAAAIVSGDPAVEYNVTSGRLEEVAAGSGAIVTARSEDQMRRPVDQEADPVTYQSQVVNISYAATAVSAAATQATQEEGAE